MNRMPARVLLFAQLSCCRYRGTPSETVRTDARAERLRIRSHQEHRGRRTQRRTATNHGASSTEQGSLPICNMLKLATDSVSSVLTSLAALELTMPDLSTRERLTIHVLGGTVRELMILRLNEEFLHLLPKLKSLVVGYIGPDIPSDADNGQLISSQCCPQCAAAGRKRQIFLRKRLYHACDEASLFPEFPRDLVVTCNSGHADEETESWRPTLERILEMDVPALFTTYDEQKIFDSMGARFVQNHEKNRWHGLAPRVENFGERYEVFYNNQFSYIVKGKR